MTDEAGHTDWRRPIPGYRRWLWLTMAFITGFAAPLLTAASFYVPGAWLPLVLTLVATPLWFPLLATVQALRARRRNGTDKRPDGGVIFLMALSLFVLTIAGAATFYLTVAQVPLIRTMMDIGAHIA